MSDHLLLSTGNNWPKVGVFVDVGKKTHYHAPNSWLWLLFLTISSSLQPAASSHHPPTVIFNIGFGTPRHNYVSNKYLFLYLAFSPFRFLLDIAEVHYLESRCVYQ